MFADRAEHRCIEMAVQYQSPKSGLMFFQRAGGFVTVAHGTFAFERDFLRLTLRGPAVKALGLPAPSRDSASQRYWVRADGEEIGFVEVHYSDSDAMTQLLQMVERVLCEHDRTGH